VLVRTDFGLCAIIGFASPAADKKKKKNRKRKRKVVTPASQHVSNMMGLRGAATTSSRP